MISTAPEKLAYSTAEAVKALSISRSKLFKHLRSGRIAHVKDGSLTLIRREALIGYLDSLPAAGTV